MTPGRHRSVRFSRRALAALVAANVLLAGAGGWLVSSGLVQRQSGDSAGAPLPPTTFSVPPAASSPATPPPSVGQRVLAAPRAGRGDGGCGAILRPSRLVISTLCIDGAIVPTSRSAAGALRIPADVHQIGLWDAGAPVAVVPRAHQPPMGTTLLAGHVNDAARGNGALYPLAGVRPGAQVLTVDDAGRVSRWQVVSLQVVLKERLPSSVFAGRAGPRRLVVVTCGGPVTDLPGYGATYRDNVVMTAVPD